MIFLVLLNCSQRYYSLEQDADEEEPCCGHIGGRGGRGVEADRLHRARRQDAVPADEAAALPRDPVVDWPRGKRVQAEI